MFDNFVGSFVYDILFKPFLVILHADSVSVFVLSLFRFSLTLLYLLPWLVTNDSCVCMPVTVSRKQFSHLGSKLTGKFTQKFPLSMDPCISRTVYYRSHALLTFAKKLREGNWVTSLRQTVCCPAAFLKVVLHKSILGWQCPVTGQYSCLTVSCHRKYFCLAVTCHRTVCLPDIVLPQDSIPAWQCPATG